MNQVAFSTFLRPGSVPGPAADNDMPSKPPRAPAGGSSNSSGALSSPKHEAEIASFLLQLKHCSPYLVHEKRDRENDASDRKDAYQSYHHGSPSTFRQQPIANPNHASVSPSYSLSALAKTYYNSPGSSSIPWDTLLNQSNLVLLKDRDLVPDALFVAMAQMVPCRLTPSDRVGCYKTRPIGYLGLCCGHCGGQPGFGRYYPNSVRSLAQTTTSQTILKHVTTKCRFCPEHIRRAILDFQHLSVMEDSPVGRPRYGSRKVFFQRIWLRLHQNDDGDDVAEGTADGSGSSGGSSTSSLCGEEEETTSVVMTMSTSSKHGMMTMMMDDAASNVTPSDLDEEHSLATYSNDTIDDATATTIGSFSNKQNCTATGKDGPAAAMNHWDGKQVKVTSPVHSLSAD